jgi:hypothetical protein
VTPRPDPHQPPEPGPPITDEWGLPVLDPPSWVAPEEVELGYCAGEDPDEDPW